MFRKALAVVGASVVSAALVTVVQPGRAEAACVAAEVYVIAENGSRQHAVGPGQCIAPTPWPVLVDYRKDVTASQLPPGHPRGAGFAVWVPAP